MAESLEKIRALMRDGEPRNNWRLRSFSEEVEAAINENISNGETYFRTAMRLMGEGDREGAVKALKSATESAEKAIEAIEG
jgi:hypothetical protein